MFLLFFKIHLLYQTTQQCVCSSHPPACSCECVSVQEVWGYRPCLWKMILVGVGSVCSGGLLLLLLYWLPEWGVKGTCTHTSLRDAHTLLLRTTVEKRQMLLSFLHVWLKNQKMIMYIFVNEALGAG